MDLNFANPFKGNDDTVYEQDILRDPHSITPWLSYIEFKHQQGNSYEQAFVRAHFISPSPLRVTQVANNVDKGHGTGLQATAQVI